MKDKERRKIEKGKKRRKEGMKGKEVGDSIPQKNTQMSTLDILMMGLKTICVDLYSPLRTDLTIGKRLEDFLPLTVQN
jgi:hypothetical protein